MVTLKFYDFGVMLQQGNLEYAVDPKEVQKILEQHSEPEAFTTGLMPSSVIYMRQQGKTAYTIDYRKPQLTGIWLETNTENKHQSCQVNMPGLIMVRNRTNNSLSHNLFAVKDDPTQKSILYHAPLPNIYNTGGVCWGNIPAEQGIQDNDLSTDWTRLFSTPFNTHSTGLKSKKYSDIRDLLRELDKDTPYPLDDLRKADRTLGSLIQSIEAKS